MDATTRTLAEQVDELCKAAHRLSAAQAAAEVATDELARGIDRASPDWARGRELVLLMEQVSGLLNQGWLSEAAERLAAMAEMIEDATALIRPATSGPPEAAPDMPAE
jgi:hypothetical protein